MWSVTKLADTIPTEPDAYYKLLHGADDETAKVLATFGLAVPMAEAEFNTYADLLKNAFLENNLNECDWVPT